MKLRAIAEKITNSPLQPLASAAFGILSAIQYHFFNFLYMLCGYRKPDTEEIRKVCENVTFMYKSFERQNMAKRLFRNIQLYYPGVNVIIADDSTHQLEILDKHAKVIQLPFNSGISVGLNCALAEVRTPYLVKLDDDELLMRRTGVGKQLAFLSQHPEVDIVSFCPLTAGLCENPFRKADRDYRKFTMSDALRPLIISHMTPVDGTHIVMGKVPNSYIARTDKIRQISWDNNIRMIDHHDFFFRAAGILVSTISTESVIFHYHNVFDRKYGTYRNDVAGDAAYLRAKRMLERR